MAGSLADVFEVDVLKAITGQATTILVTTPITPYIALFTTSSTDSTPGTEVSGGSYARISSAGKWATPSAGSVTNNAVITFATPSGSWGTVTNFAVYDAVSAGNRVGWADLTASQVISSGNTVSFAASALTITLD
jgi:hypothetical protein